MNLNLQKLKIAQAKACLSTDEISQITGLARSTVSKIMNGINKPSVKSVGLIAKALEIDVSDILVEQ